MYNLHFFLTICKINTGANKEINDPREVAFQELLDDMLAIGVDPMEAFGSDPMEAFGSDPMEAFGIDPMEAFGLDSGIDPMEAFGLDSGIDPIEAFGSDPIEAFGSDPIEAFGSDPSSMEIQPITTSYMDMLGDSITISKPQVRKTNYNIKKILFV